MAKSFYSCNLVQSRVTKEKLNGCVLTGALAKKEVIHWRVPGPENPPEPKEGEVIVFANHLSRGFSPPGSKKFCDVLHFLQLHPQDIGPNSVSNICNFQVFCEAYLQEEPMVELFRDFYYLNRRTEFVDGPNTKLGGVSIQKRKDVSFPHANHHSHPKDWNQTWFYCQDTSPAGENPLPGYRAHRLTSTHPLPPKTQCKGTGQVCTTAFKAQSLCGKWFNRH